MNKERDHLHELISLIEACNADRWPCRGAPWESPAPKLFGSVPDGGLDMFRQVELTRTQLYEMVWDRPVLVVAKEIGIYDVALAKACRRLGVPLPKRGYWASAKAGRSENVPPLPKAKPGQRTEIAFKVLENPPVKQPKVTGLVVPEIEVPKQLTKLHRLVSELKAAAKTAQVDKGVLALNYNNVLRVRTSPEHLLRALLLMDALIKEFESRDYKVRVGDRAETHLVLAEGSISFRLDERTKQTPPPSSPRGVLRLWQPAYVLVGTGEFVLGFEQYALKGCRHTWRDRPGKPLESQLNEVLEALPCWEAALKARRLEREEREAHMRENQRRRAEAARAQEILRRQRARLVNHTVAWEQAERLRRFIEIVAVSWAPSEEVNTWLEWAKTQADALDPVRSNRGALTDLGVELEEHFIGHLSWEKLPKDWWS